MKCSRLWYSLAAIAVLMLAVRISSGRMGATNAIFTDREASSDNRIVAGVWNDPGLVLDLQFDEGNGVVANDSSIYGNDGAITGTTWVSAPPYKNYALGFNGAGDMVTVLDSPSLEFNEALTVEAWFKPDVLVPFQRLVSRQEGASNWTLRCEGDTVTMWTYTSDWSVVGSGPVLVPGQWYHAVATYDGSSLNMYINGMPLGSVPASGLIGQGQAYSPITIGKPSWPEDFAGIIDRVRVYNRALTSVQILQQYQNSLGDYGP